jgi:ankyrin repeat protein
LISVGADVNLPCLPEPVAKKRFSRRSQQQHEQSQQQRMVNDIGATVLMMASEEGEPELVQAILDAKADVNAVVILALSLLCR